MDKVLKDLLDRVDKKYVEYTHNGRLYAMTEDMRPIIIEAYNSGKKEGRKEIYKPEFKDCDENGEKVITEDDIKEIIRRREQNG